MDNKKVIIPEGWTYYAHRSNTERWEEDPFSSDKIVVKGIMSAVTEDDIYQDLRYYGPKHLPGFSIGNGEPFEIRCLICRELYLRTLDDSNELKKVMLNEFYYDRRNFGGCYGQRHPSIPPKEELIVLGIGDYDEVFNKDRRIIWTISKRFLSFYKSEIEQKENRVIDIVRPNEEKNKGLD